MSAFPRKPSLRRNFLMNLLLTGSGMLFPLLTFPYVSRILLPEGSGKTQLALSVVSYFVLLAQLGIPTYGIRACAAVREDREALSRTVQELLILQGAALALSGAAFLFALHFIPRLRAERTLYLVTGSLIFFSTVGAEWLFQALEEYTYLTVRSLIFRLLSVAAIFWLVKTREDYVRYAGIQVLSAAGAGLLNLIRLPRCISVRPLGGYGFRKHLKPVLVLFAYVCATTVYTHLDSVMLGLLTTDADVGYYTVAVKIKNILVGVVTALGAVTLPRVSWYREQGKMDAFWVTAKKSLRAVLLMAVPLAVYFMLFTPWAIGFLAGADYGPAVLPMICIMPALVWIGITGITGVQILIPTGREKVTPYASLAGAAVNITLNLLLIPPLRAAGAAIGTVAAEGAVLMVHLAVLRREIRKYLHTLHIGRIGWACAVGAGASFWIGGLSLAPFWVLSISAVVFFGMYLAVLHWLKEPFVLELEAHAVKILKRA